MLRFVVDEDIARSTATVLRELGHEAEDVYDLALRGAPDQAIYTAAQQRKAVLFTADMGFANILRFPLGIHWGVVVTRFPNKLSTREINRQIKADIGRIPEDDFKGNLIIIEPARIRIRRFKTTA